MINQQPDNSASRAPNQFEAALANGFVINTPNGNTVKAELISEFAPKWAREFARRDLSMSQLRRFFAEVKSISEELKDEQAFERLLPRVQLVWAQAAHAAGKKTSTERVPTDFVEFIKACVRQVRTADDLTAFVAVFEAVVGHFVYEIKLYEDEKRQQRGRPPGDNRPRNPGQPNRGGQR